MWNRAELKSRAKSILKTNYLKSFLMSIVIAISGYCGSSGSSGAGPRGSDSLKNGSNNYFIHDYTNNNYLNNFFDRSEIVIIMIAIIILVLAYRILIGYQLEIGGRKYFVQSAQNKDNTGCVHFAFDGQNYKGIISTMFLKGIYNFLWSLLLIIPGIIKFYSYRMVPYILSDNPNIGANRAIELSKEIMHGQKFNLFVLDLSFIGWYFLGALLFGVGVLFVNPYVNATEAELYLVFKKDAIENNLCSYDELNTDFYRY